MKAPLFATLLFVSATIAGVFFVSCTAPPPSTGNTKKRDGGSMGAVDAAGTGPGGLCGAPGEGCCAGDQCDTGLRCSSQMLCCGVPGFACGGVGECCSGLACTGGNCCVGIGGSCSKPTDCCDTLLCTNGVCDKPATDCGGSGQPCCMNNTCTSGFQCDTGSMECEPCGGTNQQCCTANPKCKLGGTCNTGTNMCESSCGSTGQTCCGGTTKCKEASATCNAQNICAAAGGAGTLGNACRTTSPACNSPLTCVANKCQTPATCNVVGATCCPDPLGPKCSGTLKCAENNTCQVPPSGSTCSLALQDPCTTTAQCCDGAQCQLTVDSNICCVGSGTSCQNGDYDCCGWLKCISGSCTKRQPGERCAVNSDCMNNDCDLTMPYPESPGRCREAGTGGSCEPPLKPLGQTCTNQNQCCEGACAPLASTGQLTCCLGALADCNTSVDCCGKMVCVTASSGSSTGKVCDPRLEGQTCLNTVECLDNLPCTGGICGG